jgi:dihydrofolate reductase
MTRDRDYRVPGAVVVHGLAAALSCARRAAEQGGIDQIMVIGGEDVFREVLPQADRIYLTEVHAPPAADTWFPELDMRQWREVSREAYDAGPKDDHAFSFVVLDRVR